MLVHFIIAGLRYTRTEMAKATTVSQKLVFVEHTPTPQLSLDPVEDLLTSRANENKTTRSSLFDFLRLGNSALPLRVLFFDGKQETDITGDVSKDPWGIGYFQYAKTRVWKWDGPMGPFSNLYLFGPILWELDPVEAAMPSASLIDLLENAMPAWAMEIEEQEKRAHIPSAVREAVFLRDGGKCKYCESTKDLHYDHILAHSKGGSDTVENLQLLCQRCNLSKGSGF